MKQSQIEALLKLVTEEDYDFLRGLEYIGAHSSTFMFKETLQAMAKAVDEVLHSDVLEKTDIPDITFRNLLETYIEDYAEDDTSLSEGYYNLEDGSEYQPHRMSYHELGERFGLQ